MANSSISATAFLIADQSRVTMLMTLKDGRALPAGELARAAGLTARCRPSVSTEIKPPSSNLAR